MNARPSRPLAAIFGPVMCLLAAVSLAQAAEPAIPIEQAIVLAQKDLRMRNLEGRYYVSALTLERDGLLSRKVHWFARWSEPMPRADRRKEIGVEIAMNGEVTRVLKAPAATAATRSDRGSILDLRGH
jgi:hypothetical protein